MLRARLPFAAGMVMITMTAPDRIIAQVTFVEVGVSRGILPYQMADGMGAGIAAADYDNDGFVDVFAATAAGTPDQLYHNLGNGQFEEIATSVQLDSTDDHRSSLWFDYDGDSDLDLLVTTDVTGSATAYRLYRQDADGQFQDVTLAAGLFIPPVNPGVHHRGGVCAGDLNQDRYLDLVAAVWNGPIHVFLNNRDGTFTDISASSNIGAPCIPGDTCPFAHQPMLADFNQDGWLDLYVAVDFAPNQLWINQKNGTFIDVAAAVGADNAMNDMGMTLGDYDNDGDVDIYVTNIFDTDPQTMLPEHNILLRNDTVGSGLNLSFTEVSVSLGVDYGGWGWGTTFMDCDNDGRLDIAATNGWRSGEDYLQDSSRFYLNTGGNPVGFSDASKTVQFNDTHYGSCLISFDFDRDGDLDLMQTCQVNTANPTLIRLLENQSAARGGNGSFLVVKPRMNGPNHLAIGAIVRITADGLNMIRLITAGTSYLGQEPAEAFFGLGTAILVDSLIIDWPDGSRTTLNNVLPNQVVTVTHGGFGDLDADGDIDDGDLDIFVQCYTGPGSGPGNIIYAVGCQPSDMNGDGDVDCDDWLSFLIAYQEANGAACPPLDVSNFVAALLDIPVLPGHVCMADTNTDGTVDGLDVQTYVDAVIQP